MTYGSYRMFFRFNALVETKKLTVYKLRQNRFDRLELMKKLSDKGYNNRQISDYLNDRNLRTVRTDNLYTPKDVWIGLKKYRKRMLRYNCDNVICFTEDLVIRPFRIIENG